MFILESSQDPDWTVQGALICPAGRQLNTAQTHDVLWSYSTGILIMWQYDITQFLLSLCRTSAQKNNDIVVEMKTDKANEEAGLLNKRPSTEQVRDVC